MAGFRSYNAFLKSAKAQQGLTHSQAQSLYRELKDRLGVAPTRLSLRQHPRITKQEVSKVLRPIRAIKAEKPKRERGQRGPATPPPVKFLKSIRSLEEYEDLSEEPFDVEVIGAGVDTGRKKK